MYSLWLVYNGSSWLGFSIYFDKTFAQRELKYKHLANRRLCLKKRREQTGLSDTQLRPPHHHSSEPVLNPSAVEAVAVVLAELSCKLRLGFSGAFANAMGLANRNVNALRVMMGMVVVRDVWRGR